jgi:hypothetical protein
MEENPATIAAPATSSNNRFITFLPPNQDYTEFSRPILS